MEHLDKLIPLAVVIAVGALVVFLLRRTLREERAQAPTISVEIETVKEISAEVVTKPVVPVELVVATDAKTTVKRVPTPAASPSQPLQEMPIAEVLELLKKKNGLTTAFLLREILSPPVSQR